MRKVKLLEADSKATVIQIISCRIISPNTQHVNPWATAAADQVSLLSANNRKLKLKFLMHASSRINYFTKLRSSQTGFLSMTVSSLHSISIQSSTFRMWRNGRLASWTCSWQTHRVTWAKVSEACFLHLVESEEVKMFWRQKGSECISPTHNGCLEALLQRKNATIREKTLTIRLWVSTWIQWKERTPF